MNKLLKWAIPTLLCVIPALGAEQTGPDATFLNNPAIKDCKIIDIHEDEISGEPKLFARVQIELTTGEKAERRVPASFTGVKWLHDDANKVSQRVGKAYVFCNGKKVMLDYTKEEMHEYQTVRSSKANMLAGKEIQDIDLPLDVKVDVEEQSEHTRKDGSPHKIAQVSHQVMAEAELDGKVVKQADLLQLPGGTTLDVYKNGYTGSTPNPEIKTLIYKLSVQEKSTSREGWVCSREEQQTTYAGGFLKKPSGTVQTRHFPNKYLLTDYWNEVYKVPLINPVETLLLKGDVNKRTKKFIQAAPKDVGHCDGRFENYTLVQ